VYVAVDGIQGTGGTTVTLGELWVSYDVILMKSTLTEVEPPPIPPNPDPTPGTQYPLTFYEGQQTVAPVQGWAWGVNVWDVQGGQILTHYNTLGMNILSGNSLQFPVLGPLFGKMVYQVDLTWQALSQNAGNGTVTPPAFNTRMNDFCRKLCWDTNNTGVVCRSITNGAIDSGGSSLGTLGQGTNNFTIKMAGMLILRPVDAGTNLVLASAFTNTNPIANIFWTQGCSYTIRVSLVPDLPIYVPLG
jgi:hypothetical protein